MPMLSVTRASKKPLARRGSSDQAGGDFHLAHGELPEVPRRFVFSGERRRHHRGPAVEKALHVSRPEAVANGLEAGRLGAGGKPLASSPKTRPSRRAWRLAHSWPFSHYASARIMSRGTGGPVPASDV